MITENGIVTQANKSSAWVKTSRTGACESCSTKDSCSTAKSMKEQIVVVQNTLNVKSGDRVVIGLETKSILFLTFLLYIFPIILLVIGAIIGNSIAPLFELNPSITSMISGFSFFGLAFYFIRKKNTSLSKNKSYKPFLVRRRSQVIPTSCSAG